MMNSLPRTDRQLAQANRFLRSWHALQDSRAKRAPLINRRRGKRNYTSGETWGQYANRLEQAGLSRARK